MRILHYQRDMRLKGGGVVRFVLDVAAAVAARGHDVVVASPETAELPASWSQGRAGFPRPLRLPPTGRALDAWGSRGRRELLRALEGIDVVHIHGAWWPTNVQVGRAADRVGVPYVITPHGMLDDVALAQKRAKKLIFHALAGRRLFQRAAAVHVTAQGERAQAGKWFRAAAWSVVPPVVDFSPFRELPGPAEAIAAFPPPIPDAPVVLFLSRVHPQKHPEVLVDAVAVLKERGSPYNLFIAGPGDAEYTQSLLRRAEARGIGDRTRYLGMVSGRLKVSLYQLARVLALPSPQESFGLVLVEAMACGTPTVAAETIDIAPELREARAATLVASEPAAFADAIAGAAPDSPERARLVGAGRAWLGSHLDPDRVAMQYEAMYRDICGSCGHFSAARGV